MLSLGVRSFSMQFHEVYPLIAAPRSSRRRGWASLALVGLGLGCVFELGELQPDAGISAAGATSVATDSGGGAGGASPGGAAGSSAACPSGQKRCGDGDCVPFEPAVGCGNPDSCQPCPTSEQGSVGCADSGECVVTACNLGFADCNGEVGDGCEYSFGEVQEFSEPVVANFEVINFDGERDDWAGLPAHRMATPCENCDDPTTPAIVNQNTQPLRSDLDAYYRLAWDRDFLYLLGEVYDDHLFAQGESLVGQLEGCNEGAECEDSLMLLLDGRNNPGTYSSDDHRIYFGLSQSMAFPSQGEAKDSDVSVFARANGGSCFLIEARVRWTYLVAANNGQSIDGLLPPANGQAYGFDVAVSDVDPSPTVADAMERQSLLFWKSPGEADYRFKTTGFGRVELAGDD